MRAVKLGKAQGKGNSPSIPDLGAERGQWSGGDRAEWGGVYCDTSRTRSFSGKRGGWRHFIVCPCEPDPSLGNRPQGPAGNWTTGQETRLSQRRTVI